MIQLAANKQINSGKVEMLTSVTNIHLTANKHKHNGIKHKKKPKISSTSS
jgi:hypothetical protein